MKAIGKGINVVATVGLFMLMEMFMMVIGKMIKLMVKEFTFISTEQNTKENGKRTHNTGMEWKNGLMNLTLKVITKMERKMKKESLVGLTDHIMKVISMKIIFMEKVFIIGVMVGVTMDSG